MSARALPPPGLWTKFTSHHTYSLFHLDGDDEVEDRYVLEVVWEVDSDLSFYPHTYMLFDEDGNRVRMDDGLGHDEVWADINEEGPWTIMEEAVQQYMGEPDDGN